MGLLLFHSVWFGGKLVRSLDTDSFPFDFVWYGFAVFRYPVKWLQSNTKLFTCESKVYQVPFRILPAALNFSRPIRSRRSDWEKEPRRRLAQSLPPWAEYMSVSLLRFHHRRPGSSSIPAPPPRYPSSRRAVRQCPASPPPPNKVLLFRLR